MKTTVSEWWLTGCRVRTGRSWAADGSRRLSILLAMRWRTDFIQGMGKRVDEFIIILDVNAVFSSEELALVTDTAPRNAEPALAR